MNSHQIFRAIFVVGIIFLFSSLFLEWYSYQVFDINNDLIASWSYNVVLEWTTDLSEFYSLNILFKPDTLKMPLAIHLIFITVLLLNVYCILFKDLESTELDDKTRYYMYIHLFLLILIGFYTIIFPVGYLLPQHLYFPFAEYFDTQSNITYSYSLEFGYFLQLIAFVMVFPYLLYVLQTYLRFEKKYNKLDKMIQTIITNTQEPLNMDKYLAEEQIKLNSNSRR